MLITKTRDVWPQRVTPEEYGAGLSTDTWVRSEHRCLGSLHVLPPASGMPWQMVHLQLLAGAQNPPSVWGFASPGPCFPHVLWDSFHTQVPEGCCKARTLQEQQALP